MSMPTQSQLDKRADEANTKLATFRQSYDAFLASWESIMNEEANIQSQLSGHIDTAKMHAILTQIDSIK